MRNPNRLVHDAVARQVATSACKVRDMAYEINSLTAAFDAVTEDKTNDAARKLLNDKYETALWDRFTALRAEATFHVPNSIEGAALLVMIASGAMTTLSDDNEFERAQAVRTIKRCMFGLLRYFKTQADLTGLAAVELYSMSEWCDPNVILEKARKAEAA